MDDIAAKLTQLLDSPEGLENIKSLAGMFLNSDGNLFNNKESSNQKKSDSGSDDIGGLGISPDEIQRIMKITGALKSNSIDDDRSRLLIALKPHLSNERRERVDKAVKILKVVKLMPLIQESGIF